MLKPFFFLAALFTLLLPLRAQENHNFETAKALDIFNALYGELDLYYVDTLQAEKVVGKAIDEMLSQLDPYTSFYRESETDELRTLATGKYAGIGTGLHFHDKEGRCAFSQIYHNKPAHQAGGRPGDLIWKINGKDVGKKGKRSTREYVEDISNQLRGDVGTVVTVVVHRPGQSRPIELKITRQNIEPPVVPYHTLLPGQVGYVLLDSYTESSTTELTRALNELKAQGAQKVVFDLRSNGGGLMSQAVSVVNLFLPKGKLVIETKAKDPSLNNSLKTTEQPLDEHIPLAVLVNNSTASAAEITAGTLQDYDRAVIVGNRTFGKGLVQSTRSLPYGTAVKLTTAKYHIPSGRCIQAYDFKNLDENGAPTHLPDSLAKTFLTSNGRKVKDGGGITPDIEVPMDTLPSLLRYLWDSDEVFDFCNLYNNRHKYIAPPKEFALSDAEFEEFKTYMASSSFTYDNSTKATLESLRRLAKFEGYADLVAADLDTLEAKLSHNLSADLERRKKDIKELLEATIIGNRYGQQGYLEYQLQNDKALRSALEVLADEARYQKILHP